MQDQFDKSLAEDFMVNFNNTQKAIRTHLIELEKNPSNFDITHALFRSVHAIKGNLQMIGLKQVSDLVHHLESLLETIRQGHLAFPHLLSDFLLISMGAIHELCSDIFEHIDTSVQLELLTRVMEDLVESTINNEALINAIKSLDPTFHTPPTLLQATEQVDPQSLRDDMMFFNNLTRTMEIRLYGELGKTQRMLEMALSMNELARDPIDKTQLQAATLTHDLSMALLPLSFANNSETYTKQDRDKLHLHPKQSASLLRGLENWTEALQMVEQHHERMDGLGYPSKLDDGQICEGAKLLSVVDTFDAMSHSRADRKHRRTITRIVVEINAYSGTQFDNQWVDTFNIYIRRRYLNGKK